MKNRLIIGFFRYGSVKDKHKKDYNRVQALKEKIDLYQKTGNGECLVDMSNLCMIEFTKRSHPDFHFKAEDDKNHLKLKGE